MTWKEVKLATLQKMFSAEGLTINEADDSVSEYINAMPQAANEGCSFCAPRASICAGAWNWSRARWARPAPWT